MKKLRVALIGNGMICNAAHLPVLAHLREQGRLDIVAVADIRPQAAQETAARYAIPRWFDDPQQMLDDLAPDFVAVCTPNVHHVEWTLKALQAGAHVACEKPMAVRLADAKAIFAAAKAAGRHIFPCQCMRWRNYMQQAKRLIDDGQLGSPYFSDIAFIRRIGIPTWGMFHMREHNFGGPFCDLGVHLLDSLLWLVGSPKVLSVSGSTFTKIANRGDDVLLSIAESGAYDGTFTPRPYDYREFNVEDFATGFMRLSNGMAVNFKFSWAINLPTTNLDMVICGDQGGLSVNNETLYRNVGRYQAETKLKWFDNGKYRGRPFEQHWYMYEHILDVLDGKADYLITEAQNLEITKAIECFYRSAETAREVTPAELL